MKVLVCTTEQPTDEEYRLAKEFLQQNPPKFPCHLGNEFSTDSQKSIDILARKLGIIYLLIESAKFEALGRAMDNAIAAGYKQVHILSNDILSTNPNPDPDDFELLLQSVGMRNSVQAEALSVEGDFEMKRKYFDDSDSDYGVYITELSTWKTDEGGYMVRLEGYQQADSVDYTIDYILIGPPKYINPPKDRSDYCGSGIPDESEISEWFGVPCQWVSRHEKENIPT